MAIFHGRHPSPPQPLLLSQPGTAFSSPGQLFPLPSSFHCPPPQQGIPDTLTRVRTSPRSPHGLPGMWRRHNRHCLNLPIFAITSPFLALGPPKSTRSSPSPSSGALRNSLCIDKVIPFPKLGPWAGPPSSSLRTDLLKRTVQRKEVEVFSLARQEGPDSVSPNVDMPLGERKKRLQETEQAHLGSLPGGVASPFHQALE